MEEKSNSGGGNWEAEHAIGAYDDLIINTKEETLTITMFELLKIEQALEHQHSSNFESDYEMLQEEINKSVFKGVECRRRIPIRFEWDHPPENTLSSFQRYLNG